MIGGYYMVMSESRLAIVLIVIVTFIGGCASNTDVEPASLKDSGASVLAPKPIEDEWSRRLVGEWDVAGKSDAGTGKGWSKIEMGLNGQFLIMKGEAEVTRISDEQKQFLKKNMHVSDEDIERFQSQPFRDIEVYTIDRKTGETVGFLFDSLRCMAQGRGTHSQNKQIMKWRWNCSGQESTSVHTMEIIGDNKIVVTSRITLPDGSIMEEGGEMTRKRISTEK
jgi:hypothetical protein